MSYLSTDKIVFIYAIKGKYFAGQKYCVSKVEKRVYL